jgi:hypothetical protein
VTLYVHLTDRSLAGDGAWEDAGVVARVERGDTLVTADQVRAWCGNPSARVTVTPVLDLDQHRHVAQYQVPDRIADQADLRDRTCVFPWCTRPARSCDHDHVIPYHQGGRTETGNIAPLCRRHHRLKTHGTWRYTSLDPGTYLWTSPHGYSFLRDHHGTLDVTRDRRPPKPPPDG